MTIQLSEPKLDAVKAWCLRSKKICRAWIFGSRAKGTASPTSDLDVAVELCEADEDATIAWICNARIWRKEIATAIGPHPNVDLQPVFADDEYVMPAVKEHGVLIFERKPT